MKRYEKMSKKKIIDSISLGLRDSSCKGCPVGTEKCKELETQTCAERKLEWLTEEIKTIPRCHTFKDESDFWEAWNDWKESDHDVYPTIASYMMEEVEA